MVLKIQQLNGIFNIILIQKKGIRRGGYLYFNFVSEIFYYSNEKKYSSFVLLSFPLLIFLCSELTFYNIPASYNSFCT
jgi:hypothetical protein